MADSTTARGAAGNPVVAGFHPDPSICRVGADYYLACSSFEYFPGVPIFHSRDLVNWTQIGNALDRPSQLRLHPDGTSSGGIYAPTLRHHDGRFWLIVTNVTRGEGNLLVSATDPAGPWSEPIRLPGVEGIDPDLAWDDDGTCWCTYAGTWQLRIDPHTGETFGPPSRSWSGTPGARYPEAPHLYHIGKYWYLLIAEGGTERGHSVSIARGTTPTGPFEPCPANPILTHRGFDHPVQNTGHADLVQAPDGSWWMVLLGVRPRGGSPGWHVLGRETFLARVDWVDDWPVVELPAVLPELGWPLQPAAAAPVRDDFDAEALEPHWISLRHRPPQDCNTTERPGWLTLRARGESLDDLDVTLVGRRQQHLSCRVRALIDTVEGSGGLTVRLDELHHYEIEASTAEIRVLARIGPLRSVIATHAPGPDGQAILAVRANATAQEWQDARSGPDTVSLGVEALDGTFTALAELDGRYLSTEVAGGFTGRVIGMYAAAGTVRFDWCDYEFDDVQGN